MRLNYNVRSQLSYWKENEKRDIKPRLFREGLKRLLSFLAETICRRLLTYRCKGDFIVSINFSKSLILEKCCPFSSNS